MAKHKLKENELESVRRLAKHEAQANRQVVDERQQKLVAQWENEINQLTAQTFQTEEQAISALIEQVLSKYPTKDELYTKSKEFIYELIDSDEGIKQYLRASLKIKQA